MATSDADRETDRQLVATFLRGRRESAFRALYRRHTPRMLRLSRKLSAATGITADDLVQEAWLRAIGALPGFEWRSSLATWLAGFVINVMREQQRPWRRVAAAPEADGEQPTPDMLINIELAETMRRLPPGFRSVVALHDIAGFTHDEISNILGIDPGTSKSQLARARRRLRAMLGAATAKWTG